MSESAKLHVDAWEALLRTQAHLLRRFEHAGDFKPLSAREYDVLYTLVSNGGRVAMKELVQKALIPQPSLSRLVDRLVNKGLLRRLPNKQDGRAVDVEITPQGEEMQRTIGRVHVRTITKEMATLTTQEMQDLIRLCTTLRKGRS